MGETIELTNLFLFSAILFIISGLMAGFLSNLCWKWTKYYQLMLLGVYQFLLPLWIMNYFIGDPILFLYNFIGEMFQLKREGNLNRETVVDYVQWYFRKLRKVHREFQKAILRVFD